MADPISPGSGAGLGFAACLAALEHEREIRALVALYAYAFDDNDIARVASLFTPDGRLCTGAIGGDVQGRAAIAAALAQRHDGVTLVSHVTHNHLIKLRGDHATGLVTAHVELVRHGTIIVGAMRYRDHYVDWGGAWRFAERRLAMLYYLPLGDYPGALVARARIAGANGFVDADYPDGQSWAAEFFEENQR